MNLKLIDKNKERISFYIKDTEAAYINTLRRMIMEEVPTMAVEEVNFIQNTSALYDEMLALRIGLIVVKTDLKSYKLPEECKCEGKGCAQCEAYATVKKTGPGNLYAEDIKFKDPKLKVVYPKTLIVKLDDGQEVNAQLKLVLGKGKDHAKFIPGLVYYNAVPKIDILKPTVATDAVKVCPKNVFRVANKKLNVEELEKCDLCMACVEALGKDVINVEGSKKEFVMFIEPWGQLKPQEMIEEAMKELDKKLNEFNSKIKNLK
ncbi:MAG: DNA-directed RNA polymerase subunit D [Candidatus Nanoarchaeia archaeon]|nr:DNA-directed RNA polymerase subunit D [Candidatus Nanoarchaeia archaeon]